MSAAAQPDWFAQNAPHPAVVASGDWFDQNAPKAAPQGFWDKVQATLPGTADTGLKGAVNHIQDTLSFLKGTYDVSAPGIAQQIYKKLSGQPNELKSLPGKMVTAFALGGEGEPGIEGEALLPRPEAVAPDAAAAQSSGALSRALEIIKRRAGNIPGVQAAKDLDYVLRGPDAEPVTPTKPAAPSVPDNWGKGKYGTPVDQWGKKIPQTPAVETPATTPAAVAAPKITPKAVEQQLETALGGQKLVPNVPLRAQPAAQAAAAGKLPEGFTATPDSSLLKGYKYDPGKQEFSAVLNNGESYTHGEVSPDQVKAFEDADSQGSAWTKTIKQGPGTVLVKKNGRPVIKAAPLTDLAQQIKDSADPSQAPVGKTLGDLNKQIKASAKTSAQPKPAAAAATDDLEDQVTQMLKQVKGGKKLRDLAGN